MIRINTSSFGKHDAAPLELLRSRFAEVELNPYGRKLAKAEVIELCRMADGLIAGTEVLDAEVLEACDRLKVISRCGVGMDNVDLEAARRRGVVVLNTPDAPSLPVAELTIGLLLDLARRISRHDADLKAGVWTKRMGRLLSAMRVGVVGFGRIGRKTAELLRAFGCEVRFSDPCMADGTEGCRGLPMDELLGWADAVVLHASCNELLLGAREFDLMRPDALLVNVARGEAVDEAALYERLKAGSLGGAALDVFGKEPYVGPLRELPNVVLTPHIGSYALEGRIRMEMEAVANLLQAMEASA